MNVPFPALPCAGPDGATGRVEGAAIAGAGLAFWVGFDSDAVLAAEVVVVVEEEGDFQEGTISCQSSVLSNTYLVSASNSFAFP